MNNQNKQSTNVSAFAKAVAGGNGNPVLNKQGQNSAVLTAPPLPPVAQNGTFQQRVVSGSQVVNNNANSQAITSSPTPTPTPPSPSPSPSTPTPTPTPPSPSRSVSSASAHPVAPPSAPPVAPTPVVTSLDKNLNAVPPVPLKHGVQNDLPKAGVDNISGKKNEVKKAILEVDSNKKNSLGGIPLGSTQKADLNKGTLKNVIKGGEETKIPDNIDLSKKREWISEKQKISKKPLEQANSFTRGDKLANEQTSAKEDVKLRTVIFPDGKIAKQKVGGVAKLRNEEVDLRIKSKKPLGKNVVDLQQKKAEVNTPVKRSVEPPVRKQRTIIGGGMGSNITPKKQTISIIGNDKKGDDDMEEWKNSKFDFENFSEEDRLNFQATPALASVNMDMMEDTNGQRMDCLAECDKLSVNIRFGLRSKEINFLIRELAKKFDLEDNKHLGEIARIIREVYTRLIKGSEIRERLAKNLKIEKENVETFMGEIGKIVRAVRDVGTKKSGEYFVKLSVKDVLERYANAGNQDVTTDRIIKNSRVQSPQGGSVVIKEYIRPTVQNWLNDYMLVLGSSKHTHLDRGRYLSDSVNTIGLDEEDKKKVERLIESYDKNSLLLVESETGEIMWNSYDEQIPVGASRKRISKSNRAIGKQGVVNKNVTIPTKSKSINKINPDENIEDIINKTDNPGKKELNLSSEVTTLKKER